MAHDEVHADHTLAGEKNEAMHVDRSELSTTPPNEAASDDRMTWHTWAGLLSLQVTVNAYLFTQIMPASLLAYINADLGPDPNYVWISVSWSLVAAVVVTVSGRFADIFGRRWFLIAGAAISTIGAIVGATSQSINQSIASGVLFGLGGGMQEMVFSCIQELVPYNRRLLAIGIFEFCNLPSMFSSLIAYAFIAHLKTGWRTAYYFCIAVEGAATLLMFLFYHPPSFKTKHRLDGKTRLQLVMETDFVGLILFSAACAIILMAINWGGTLHPWKSAAVIAPIVVGGVLFIILGFWEAYADLKHPLLPGRLFRRFRDFTAFLIVTFVAGMLYYSNLIIWPRLTSLIFIPGASVMKRGLYANIANWATPIAATYGFVLMPWLGHERWQVTGLASLQTIFTGAMSTVGRHSQGMTIPFLLISTASATATNILVFGAVGLLLEDQADIGVALGLVSTSRLIGGAVAGAIYTSIYTNRFGEVIPGVLENYATNAGFTGSFSSLLAAAKLNTAAAYAKVAGITPQVQAAAALAVQESYIKSFRLVFYVAIAFGVVAVCAALTTRTVPLSRKTARRAVTMENEKGQHGDAEKSA